MTISHLPASCQHRQKPKLEHALAVLVTICLLAGGSCSNADYAVEFEAQLQPENANAAASISITQTSRQLKQLSLKNNNQRYSNFSATAGKLQINTSEVMWQVPSEGGRLSYDVAINSSRPGGHDARIEEDWALLRFEDLFPPTTTRTRKGSIGRSQVSVQGPKDWSIETPYGRMQNKPLAVVSAESRFDKPAGWLIAGLLGVRRDTIAGRNVVVAAPRDSGYPRVPTLAFLRWTLPELVSVFPTTPEHLLIVSGDDAMWRGALSGPSSVYLHSDRPLISENATSTLLHEIVHVATRLSGKSGDDWIVEGLAEYYTLELLRRSNGISPERFEAAFQFLQNWADQGQGILTSPSSGANTARAALLFRALNMELKDVGGLDSVVTQVLADQSGRRSIDRVELGKLVASKLGKPSEVLAGALSGKS